MTTGLFLHITCCSWLLEVDINQAGGLEKFTSLGKQVGRGLEIEANVESVTAERACSNGNGTGNGLGVFPGTCQASLGSWRVGTPWETDSEMSSSLGMKSVAVSSLKPMLRVSLPREAAAKTLAMAWRSSLAHGRQSEGGKSAVKCGKK